MSYTLSTINASIVRSANGNVKLTQTVVNVVAALGRVRNTMTAEDVAHIVNATVYSDEKVTEKQIEQAIRQMVQATVRGERYNGMRKGLYNIGCGFYEYR